MTLSITNPLFDRRIMQIGLLEIEFFKTAHSACRLASHLAKSLVRTRNTACIARVNSENKNIE